LSTLTSDNTPAWSSQFAAYLGTIGAAVGLGSIWRFPYLAGTFGGGTFIVAFVLACIFIATPLLTAEFMIGRHARLPPTLSPGVLAASIGASRRWNAIGTLGTLAVFLIGSYYTLIAGWVVAYAVKCLRGDLVGLARPAVQAEWHAFLADPWQLMGWQLLFLLLVAFISGRGVGRGIEVASRIRAPALLVLLLLLDGYALCMGDVAAAMHFAFALHWEGLNAGAVLAAIGQAFFATGVGCAMMLSYGSYMSPAASLVRPALAISGSILLVSLLATLLVFPLVFRYHMDPAGGPALVFDVLPTMFAVMPAGRLIGTVFFVLLIFAALTPMLACFEPLVGWLGARGWSRRRAAAASAVAVWAAGLGSLLSFNVLAEWHPLEAVPLFAGKTLFEVIDFVAGNLLAPAGALLTCLLTGWRLSRATFESELSATEPLVRRTCRVLLRYVAPLAIGAVMLLAFLPGRA
jgi:NSS family neurotransmitter:Na+ symporter